MKLKTLLLLLFNFVLALKINAQETQEPVAVRKFNAGVSTGIFGLHWAFKPVLEVKIKNTSFRATPGFLYWGAAIEQEFEWKRTGRLHLYSLADKTNFVFAAQFQHQFRDFCPDLCRTTNYTNFVSLLGGIKTYRGRHFRYIKLGAFVAQTKKYPGNNFDGINPSPTISNWAYPFGEMGWGIYIFNE